MHSGISTGDSRWSKLALIVGFCSLSLAVTAAIVAPATAFELSLYSATPLVFWFGAGSALLMSLLVGWFARWGRVRAIACVLGGGTITTIVALPLIRGYYFFGHADAMTHLGWVKNLAAGEIGPTAFIYPGTHLLSVFVSETTGYPVRRALMLVVVLVSVLFLLLFPLAVRRLLDRERIVTIAAFSAFLLLPVNLLSTHLQAHPFTQALLYSTLVLFVLFVYLGIAPSSAASERRSVGAFLGLTTAGVVFYHPQQAVNLLVVFAAITTYQALARRLGWDRRSQSLYGQTVWFAAVFLGWTAVQYSQIDGPASNLATGVLRYLRGAPPTAGGAVTSQSQSLSAIGAGLVEMYLKLFLVSTIYIALAGLVVLAVFLNRTDQRFPNRQVTFLTAGLVAMTPLPVLYFLADVAEHYFRHYGFIMLLVSVLSILAISEAESWADALPTGMFESAYRYGVPVALGVMLVLSVITIYPSPYIYKSNRHVTESEMRGFSLAFDHVENESAMVGIRAKLYRYQDAIKGTEGSPNNERTLTGSNLTSLPAFFDREGYLIYSQYAREREVGAYRELRFTEEEFESVSRQPGVDKLLANREVSLYHVG
jgi:hypothetical protein